MDWGKLESNRDAQKNMWFLKWKHIWDKQVKPTKRLALAMYIKGDLSQDHQNRRDSSATHHFAVLLTLSFSYGIDSVPALRMVNHSIGLCDLQWGWRNTIVCYLQPTKCLGANQTLLPPFDLTMTRSASVLFNPLLLLKELMSGILIWEARKPCSGRAENPWRLYRLFRLLLA